MAGGGGHGQLQDQYTALSHSCSSTSDRSETRKRRSSPHNTEEEENATHEKPYECRFCPMKFSKSQALGGHMNRHRQEREREQLMHARQLLLQQDLSSSFNLMPGVHNASAPTLSRIHQHHLQRSSSDSSLRHSARMGVAGPGPYTTYSQGQQPGTYVSAVTSPRASPSWNFGVPNPGSSQSMASVPNSNQLSSLDGMLPVLPSRQMVRFPPNNVACIMQQPLSAAQVPRQDMLQRTFSEKSSMQLQDWNAPLQVINPTQAMSHHNSEPIVQSEDGLDECIKRSCSDILQDMLPGSNLIEKGSTDGAKAMSESLSILPETSQQSDAETSNQSHGQSSQAELSKYPSLGGRMKTTMSSASSSPEVPMLSASHLDGLSWGYGTSKSAPVIGFLTSHDLDTELIMKDVPAGASEESKPVRWDLGLPIRNPNDETEGSVRDLAISRGASPLHFALDFVAHTGAPNEAKK